MVEENKVICPECSEKLSVKEAFKEEVAGNLVYVCYECEKEFIEFKADFTKGKLLEKCINHIKGKGMKKWIRKFLSEKVPDYFWKIPASSTGKYHPKFAQGKEGLIRHTRVVVNNALTMFELEQFNFDAQEKDIILAALIIHDTFKHGAEKGIYSVANHGVICGDMVKKESIPDTVKIRLVNAIKSHMGQWNTDYKSGKKIAPKPETDLENFVHLCDYLASRKYLEVNMKELEV